MHIINVLLTTAIAGALTMTSTTPAIADGATNFGTHVRDCHKSMGFNGLHNPGMHRGAAGWEGQPCP